MTTMQEPDPRTRIRRYPERGQTQEEAEAILREGLIAHVACVRDGQPVVLPFTYLYEDGAIYLHGAPAAGTIKEGRRGAPICVEVTLLAALIASRTAENHSVNYRTAVAFGTATVIRDHARKTELLERLIARYFPGRRAGVDYAQTTTQELKATELLEVRIEALSAKTRDGGPKGPDDDDPAAPGSAGVLPLPPGPRSV